MSFLKKHLKKIIIAAILIALIFGFYKYKNQNSVSTNKFNQKNQTTIQAKRETIKEQINLTGSVNATLKASLHFQTSGQLAWVGVKTGDTVKKYQAIASLNKEVLKKQLELELNNYKSAASNFYDTGDDYKDSALNTEIRRILDRNQNTLNNSVISYELSDLAVKYATLTTPISGTVVSVDQPNTGINILATDTIATIIDPQSIYFQSKVDQEDVPKIKIGDKATITLDSFSDKPFESQINHISFTPVNGETSTLYEIRLDLPKDNNDLKYRIGMDGDIVITLNQKDNTLTLPVDSIHQENDQYFVWVKDGNNPTLIKKPIKTGIENNTVVEILEGISENDQIVIAK